MLIAYGDAVMGEMAGGALKWGDSLAKFQSSRKDIHKKSACLSFWVEKSANGKIQMPYTWKIDQWENSDAKNPVQSELSNFCGLFWEFILFSSQIYNNYFINIIYYIIIN